jgi:glucose 1-dehydrogenase
MPKDPTAAVRDNAEPPKNVCATTLQGHLALIARASSGIGKATAFGPAQAGPYIAVNYIGDPAQVEEIAHQIEGFGSRAIAFAADVLKEGRVQAMFAKSISHFDTQHVAVSNAWLQCDAPFDQVTLWQWETMVGVNRIWQFLTAREAVRGFKRRGVVKNILMAAGKIVCMSSVHQEIPWAGHVNYATSKGGIMMMMMKSIAQEVAPHRIRVNAVAPGAIRTPINTTAWSTPEAYAELMELVPYKRIGEPDDIARAVAWLASDAADYVTGATLFVDGGMSLYPGFATGG